KKRMASKLPTFLLGMTAGSAAVLGFACRWYQQVAAREDNFRDVLRNLTVGANPKEVLQRIAERAAMLTKANGAYVEQLDKARNEIVIAACLGERDLPTEGTRGPYPGSLAAKAIERGKPISI